MNSSEYKAAKELFVSNTKGSTITHINSISFIAFASLSLYTSLRTRLPSFPPTRPLPLFCVQFILLVLPLLGAVTYAAQGLTGFDALEWNVVFGMLVLVVCLRFDSKRRTVAESIPTSSPNPSKSELQLDQAFQTQQGEWLRPNGVPQLPAVTTWRAHMMLMTVLGILAVDFPVFPRSLAKCETFGVSLVRLSDRLPSQLIDGWFTDGPWCRILHLCPGCGISAATNKGYRPPLKANWSKDLGKPEEDVPAPPSGLSPLSTGKRHRLSGSVYPGCSQYCGF